MMEIVLGTDPYSAGMLRVKAMIGNSTGWAMDSRLFLLGYEDVLCYEVMIESPRLCVLTRDLLIVCEVGQAPTRYLSSSSGNNL